MIVFCVKDLVLGRDYALSYSNNVKTGTGTLTVVGKGEYSGSKKVTFKIAGQDVSNLQVAVNGKEYDGSSESSIAATVASVEYMQGATIPAVTVSSNGLILREGIDYTVGYGNNKAVALYTATNPKNGKSIAPTVIIKGKGLFAGSVSIPFNIVKQDMAHLTNISVTDVVWTDKNNNFVSKVSAADLNGKALKEGKDFKVTYYEGAFVVDTIDESKKLDNTAKPAPKVAAGSVITALIEATDNGSYAGKISLQYRVLADKADLKNISKGKIVVLPQTYTGREILISDQATQIDAANTYYAIDKNTKSPLVLGTDFEVVGYLKNINKGTATVIVRGKGAYTGIKKVTFKINVKGIK